MAGTRTVPIVGKKAPEDAEMEERVRAHIRRRMTQLKIGVTEAADRCGCDQGNLSKILRRGRGLGLGMAARLIEGLQMDPLLVLTTDPPSEFFEPYVPTPPVENNGRR